jgi:hypothetical protein
MSSKLALYNGALSVQGERTLASLSENRPSRRRLDAVWDGGGVKFCLEQGNWNFAMRDISIEFSPSVEPQYGFLYAFNKPDDWCRTFMVSADPTYACPLLDREDQAGYWFANVNPIYVRLVSDDVLFGGDLSKWPQSFTSFAEDYFAWKSAPAQLGSIRSRSEIEPALKKSLSRALANDALNETTRFPPRGTWSRSRAGQSMRSDRGNPNKLYG